MLAGESMGEAVRIMFNMLGDPWYWPAIQALLEEEQDGTRRAELVEELHRVIFKRLLTTVGIMHRPRRGLNKCPSSNSSAPRPMQHGM